MYEIASRDCHTCSPLSQCTPHIPVGQRERAPVFDEATIPQDVWSSLSPTARMALSSVFITFRRHLGDLSSSLASDLLANFKSFLLGSDLLFAPLDADPEVPRVTPVSCRGSYLLLSVVTEWVPVRASPYSSV